ncbi:MAG: NAD(P)H-hydrate dehydratase [Candidatus Woesebacteria bacterium]
MDISHYTAKIHRMDKGSHKGQNGKVMVIGGSELFHAASAWALEVVSAMVDMVFYSSVPENNKLIAEAKKNFWSGVVVPRGEVKNYIDEANVILIGPGMTREEDTKRITDDLLSAYPTKKWVVDAGALQMMEPAKLNEHMIITPHASEYERLIGNAKGEDVLETGVTILLKGQEDQVFTKDSKEVITGGNPGMTKGGTGDALAGLVAGLYTLTEDPFVAAVVGSYVNKKAGDELYKSVGPFFTTNQLVEQIPKTLKDVLGY